MDNIVFVVTMGFCCLLFLYLGYYLWKKEKISIIHDYHYTKVKESDKKPYTAIMGKALIVIAIGMMFSGIIGVFIDSAISIIPFGIAFAIGLGMMTYAQIKYNHGIF